MHRNDNERFARHMQLPGFGEHGQNAVFAASASLSIPEGNGRAEHLAAQFLVASGVGQLALANASDAQRADLAARSSHTRISAEAGGTHVVMPKRPAWWPTSSGDNEALAFYRGGLAAVQWLRDTVQ